jgi:hypothetical protein
MVEATDDTFTLEEVNLLGEEALQDIQPALQSILQKNKNMSGEEFEKTVYEHLQAKIGSLGKVVQTKSQEFPDVVIQIGSHRFGVEVKHTTGSSWRSARGNSVMESKRIDDVNKIWLLFGKSGDGAAVKSRPYEQCLADISMGHGTRYMVDMDLKENTTIFERMGISYHDFKSSPQQANWLFQMYKEAKDKLPWWMNPSISKPAMHLPTPDVHIDPKAEAEFTALLSKAQKLVNEKMQGHTDMDGDEFETMVYTAFCQAAHSTPFEGTMVRSEKGALPDVYTKRPNYPFGVEIKKTKSDKWKTTGNSTTEMGRVEGVERIWFLFGKFGKSPESRFRKYEECLASIRVSHQPRYVIDMEAEGTVMDELGTSYEQFRQDPARTQKALAYYKGKYNIPW